MPTTDIFANLPTATPTLGANVLTTPAAGTVETWTFAGITWGTAVNQVPIPTATQQLRFLVGTEVCYLSAVSGNTGSVTRGQEKSTVATHANGDPVYFGLTAGGAANLVQRGNFPYLYLPDGWDTGWAAAKATIATTPANIFFEGDSNTLGMNSSNFMTTAYPFVLRSSLTALYGAHADYYVSAMAGAGTLPFTLTGGGSAMNAAGPACINHHYLNASQVAFGTIGDWSFTTPYACTAIDLIMVDLTNTTGTFQYNVDKTDGTGLVTITTPGFNSGTPCPYRVAITSLPNTTHTIRVGNASPGYAGVCGVVTYTGTTGGLSYGFAGVNAVGGSIWANTAQTLGGFYKTSLGDTAHPTGFGFPAQPDLLVLQWGTNDAQFGYSLDAFRIAIHSLITGARRGKPSCSIILLATAMPNNLSDQTNLFSNTDNYPMFMTVLRDLAEFYNCAFVDMHAKWGSTPVARGFMTTANPHPNDAGYADIAATLLGIL